MLRYHYTFNHASLKKLRILAKHGVIPHRLAKCDSPICSACMYGKATRRPWRTRSLANQDEALVPTKPGQVVSVDQLASPTPGLIAQITGTLTTKRYKHATMFVNHYLDLSFVHLQKTTDADETLEAKKAFEQFAASHGVYILHYHADNGVFRAHKWVNECKQKRQGLTFAGVNVHHQNGKAEVQIRYLQDSTRTSLIHATKDGEK
jgi:hypothetical protein